MLACTPSQDAPSSQELSAVEETSEAPARLPEVVLDTREDGARIVGRVLPVLPGTDADRILVLIAEGLEPSVEATLEATRAIEARFVDGGVVVLGADRVLRFHSRSGETRELDREVYGPLSVAGADLAYVRGGPPDLELMRVDVSTGVVDAVTEAMAPVWSPALSPDGREIVFVSGVEGAPRLYHADPAGTIAALALTGRTPSAASPPRWTGSTLVFEDEAGVAVLDLEREAIVHELPEAHRLTELRDGSLAASIAGGPIERLELPRGVR